MKVLHFITLSFLIVLPEITQAELFLIDEMKCVVCGPAYNQPFVDTDISWKRTLENQFVSMQKQMQADIVKQQIISDKLPLDPDGAPKYIEGLKKQLKINDAELETLFSEVGRTMAEGLEMLQTFYATEFFTHYKFKSQLVPNDEEIAEYFNENPEFIDGSYEISIARIPYEAGEQEKIKKIIEEALVNNTDGDGLIIWGNPIKIGVDDLNSDQKFITEMQPEGVRIQAADGMFELVRLISYEPTCLKTLAERQNSIIDSLNRKKLETMLQKYNDSVSEFVDVITFEEFAQKVIEA